MNFSFTKKTLFFLISLTHFFLLTFFLNFFFTKNHDVVNFKKNLKKYICKNLLTK